MKKKSAKKKLRLIDLHVYGIFDKKKDTIIKLSLDKTEIQMEIALMGNIGEVLTECEFDIKLAL
jgi:hypothetical protein